MNTTLLVIIGIIIVSWLIALCFKDFRDDCKEYAPELYSDLLTMLKEDDTGGILYKIFLVLFVFLIMYPLIVILITFIPIMRGVVDIWHVIKDWIRKYIKKDYSVEQRIEENNRHNEMERWRDSRIKAFFYEGKAPFTFDRDTYLYLENAPNESVSQCVERNLDKINKVFSEYGFRFIYLPNWEPDSSNIHLANIPKEREVQVKCFLDRINTVEYTHLLCKALHIDKEEINSGIFHFACYMYDDPLSRTEILQTKFTHFSMHDVTDYTIEAFCRKYCDMIVDGRNQPCGAFFSVKAKRNLSDWDFYEIHGKVRENYADYTFPDNMKDIAENVKKEIEKLKEGGYFELLLHTLDDETINEFRNVKLNPSLSKIEIKSDYKIWLSDYGKEIKLTPLQKTLYIFYLRHPEGVAFKMLSAYYDELLSIYKVLSNREDLQKQQRSIRRLVDTTDNAINEKCSRIKEAFLNVVDDFIARNYYLCLKKEEYKENNYIYTNLLKKITLPRELVIYPEDIRNIPILEPKERMRAIELDLRKQDDRYNSLNHHYYDKNYPKGKLIEEYTEFLNENPQYYRGYRDRAILYTHVGRYREAIADNDKLIEHNEWLWMEALINKAEALYFLKEYGLALKCAKRYFDLEEEPELEAYHIRSEIYRKLKMYDECDADIRMMKKLEKEKKKENKLPF